MQAVAKVQPQTTVKVETPELEEEKVVSSLFVKSDKKIIKLELDEINHIEAYGNYIKIFSETMVLTPQTLTNFLDKLPSNFLQIHKSYVMNFNALKLIDGNQIILKNNTKLPIGKSYRKAILERL